MPFGADSPKERFALGDIQERTLAELRTAARKHSHRLLLLDSAASDARGHAVSTVIHSKLLIVDDRLLTLGSANCTNRSMSLDSELNFAWDSAGPEDPRSLSLARLRARLICEHAGIPYHRSLEQTHGFVDRLRALVGRSKLRQRPAQTPPPGTNGELLRELAFDPEVALTDLDVEDLLGARREPEAQPETSPAR